MNFKSEKGFTGVDITVALILILVFMSLIAIIFFNITKTSKGIDRNAEATYYATTIIENIKAQDYDNVRTTGSDVWVQAENYTYANGDSLNLDIEDGYTCTINIANHYSGNTRNDVVKVVNIKVEYKLAKEIKEVNLSTTLVREF